MSRLYDGDIEICSLKGLSFGSKDYTKEGAALEPNEISLLETGH